MIRHDANIQKKIGKTLYFSDPKPGAELSPQIVSLIWADYDRCGQRVVAGNYLDLNDHST